MIRWMLVAWLLAPTTALAQDAPPQAEEERPAARQVRPGVIRFEEEVVKGEVQRPAVQILITRQDIGSIDDLDLQQSFQDRIIDATLKEPF